MPNVIAGMATIRGREELRAIAINSLIGQVDSLIASAGDELGDQAKFLGCEHAPADTVWLGVDDDLIYPPDYVATILAGLDRHPGCVVSFHGWRFDDEGEPYAENYRCLERVVDEVEVHVAGTGVCGFHLDTIRPVMADFESINADVWLSLRAQERGIRRVVLAHPSYWLGYAQLPGVYGDLDGERTTLSESVYTHTRYATGTKMDGSEGFANATGQLKEMLYGCTVSS